MKDSTQGSAYYQVIIKYQTPSVLKESQYAMHSIFLKFIIALSSYEKINQTFLVAKCLRLKRKTDIWYNSVELQGISKYPLWSSCSKIYVFLNIFKINKVYLWSWYNSTKHMKQMKLHISREATVLKAVWNKIIE